MKLPFTDLRRQYLAVERELKARIENVLTHGQYIMGPEVQELEEALRVSSAPNTVSPYPVAQMRS